MNTRTKGKQGETLFKSIMQSKGYEVQDVSAEPEYWEKDIDFIITSPTTGLTKTFEVKYDYCINYTGNLYIELTNIYSKGGKGWFQFCQADLLAYGDAHNNIFYIIDMEQLRKHLFFNQYKVTGCNGDSTGLLVPLADIKHFTNILGGN